jgi:hypothetical protein
MKQPIERILAADRAGAGLQPPDGARGGGHRAGIRQDHRRRGVDRTRFGGRHRSIRIGLQSKRRSPWLISQGFTKSPQKNIRLLRGRLLQPDTYGANASITVKEPLHKPSADGRDMMRNGVDGCARVGGDEAVDAGGGGV